MQNVPGLQRSRVCRGAAAAWQGSLTPVYAITETRLLPAKTQRFIEFLRERLART